MPHTATPPANHTSSPNTAFHETTSEASWIELYHSRPSWKVSQISFRKNLEPTWQPFGKYQLLDASHIRKGFRAFRLRANRLEFRLADERAAVIDSNAGRNYIIEAPGRYVVESVHGCRRVSDAQIPDCIRPLRPHDKYVDLLFRAPHLWPRCYVTFALLSEQDQSTWFKMPMKKHLSDDVWFQRLDAPFGITCAFTDGALHWDNNSTLNYHIRLPGKYSLGAGRLTYSGPSDLDAHLT